MAEKNIYKPIKPFNDHPGCKGHANWMLDCTYEKQSERDALSRALEGYITKNNNGTQGKKDLSQVGC